MKPFDVSDLARNASCSKAQEMCERIKEVIYDYGGDVPLALAVGVLEIVKKEIMEE